MRVFLELDSEVARALQPSSGARPAAHPPATELQRLAADLGTRLQPVHPGSADPRLANQFFADIADDGSAGAALSRLKGCAAVSAAYAKPADEAPR